MIAHHKSAEFTGSAADCSPCHHDITSKTDQYVDLTPVSFEYTADSLVKVRLKSRDGNMVHATMSTAALMEFVGMAVQLVNSNTTQVISQLAKVS